MHRAQWHTLRRLRNIYGDCRRDCAIIWTHVDPLSRDALRATEKKVSLILVRGSQSYLSWFIVSLLQVEREREERIEKRKTILDSRDHNYVLNA